MAKKRRFSRVYFYWLLAAFFLVLAISIVPGIFPRVTYPPFASRIVMFAFSLLVALFTFGFLGDSRAFISQESESGLAMQAGGSIAGALIVFIFLMFGLSPSYKVVVHIRDLAEQRVVDARGRILLTFDGEEASKLIPPQSASVTFQHVPVGEVYRVDFQSYRWELLTRQPEWCFSETYTTRCKEITLVVGKVPVGRLRTTISSRSRRSEEITLNDHIEWLQDFLNHSGVTLYVDQSDNLSSLTDQIDSPLVPFSVQRDYGEEITVAKYLIQVQNEHNSVNPSHQIRIWANTDTVWLGYQSEDPNENLTDSDPRRYVQCELIQ